jgi:hypothetical protein
VPQRVLVQFPGFRGIVAHPEEIVDRVLVFLAAQPVVRHGRTRRHPGRATFLEPRVETGDEGGDLLLGRPFFLLRWHLARVHLFDHLRPKMRVGAQLEIPRELVDAQVTLFLLRPMAREAMRLEEDIEGLGSAGRAGEESAGGEKGDGTEGIQEG